MWVVGMWVMCMWFVDMRMMCMRVVRVRRVAVRVVRVERVVMGAMAMAGWHLATRGPGMSGKEYDESKNAHGWACWSTSRKSLRLTLCSEKFSMLCDGISVPIIF